MWQLRPTDFAELPGWREDDHGAALATFRRHGEKPAAERYRTGRLGIAPDPLIDLARKAGDRRARLSPRAFFEAHFAPFRLHARNGARGLVTGFFEPVLPASRDRKPPFATPLLRRPPDLVAVDKAGRPPELDAGFRFARRLPDGRLAEYPDRAAIEAGALAGQGLEIAWLADPVDAFFVHVQGAARLAMDDGSVMRVSYDGKTGHPFTAIGRLLVERGEIDAETVSMQTIRAWLTGHRDRAAALMRENRSYIFFKAMPPGDPRDGPVAAAKIPLTAHRSLAVDRLIHTFGTPIHVHADAVAGKPVRRLMIAQETGSAIVGPARGDIFFGTGETAGEAAGGVRSACDFTVLVPRALAERLPGELDA
ncbi:MULTISPECIES: MltA domain-containing protein [unclassified Roseitalea]|uniref:murein transglycosylase A n=1 Tax=unclassified Roseitalea TaxID=2639107 RepID=UPI00273D9964|nr:MULTISPECIES: MltA domain-containing protein [unclassified Roseitalea]